MHTHTQNAATTPVTRNQPDYGSPVVSPGICHPAPLTLLRHFLRAFSFSFFYLFWVSIFLFFLFFPFHFVFSSNSVSSFFLLFFFLFISNSSVQARSNAEGEETPARYSSVTHCQCGGADVLHKTVAPIHMHKLTCIHMCATRQ